MKTDTDIIDLYREVIGGVVKTYRWKQHLLDEDQADEDAIDSANLDLLATIDMAENMLEPGWPESYLERVQADNRGKLKAYRIGKKHEREAAKAQANRDYQSWIEQHRLNYERIGKALAPLRSYRGSGEPSKSDAHEIELLAAGYRNLANQIDAAQAELSALRSLRDAVASFFVRNIDKSGREFSVSWDGQRMSDLFNHPAVADLVPKSKHEV